MHNLYQILGVNKDASEFAIKKAFRMKSLTEHPDKGGNEQRMVLLIEAYATLSDPDEREKFDKEWEVFNASLYPERHVRPSGCLPTAGVAFSQSFRHQYAEFLIKNLFKRPKKIPAFNYLTSYYSDLYPCHDNVKNDLFSFLKTKSNVDSKLNLMPLTPERAVEYFIHFLQGDYFGNNLKELSRSFYRKIKQLGNSLQQAGSEFKLYCGIYEIFLVAVKEKTPSLHILDSLNKITEYSKHNADQTMSFMAPLFQSKYFRSLFLQALHFYWRNGRMLDISCFDGRVAAEQIFERLKSRLSESRSAGKSNDLVVKLLQRVRLLFTLEQDLFASTDEIEDKLTADFYREKAFHLLDWLPSLMGFADRAIIVNTLLQIGIALLTASRHEWNSELSMADEKLATQIYVEATSLARYETPDVEFYACLHSVKCLLTCRYPDSEFKDILEGLQNRALWLADLFPFFQSPQSNADFMEKEDKPLDQMRSLLHALVDKVECLNGPSEIDHSYVRVIYQAYEACLKNWYQDDHDAEKESNFRQRLMKELLASKQWTVEDINYNLNAPWPLTDLDEEGWTCPKSSILSLAKKAKAPTYKTIHGAEFNYKTGEINFILDYCADNENDYNRLLTPFDLSELFQRRLISAVFSLDPVDPDMPYHPFNNMRFKPSTLYHSQLLHTMFITDYLLKFMTVDQEVQRVYPYDLRSLDRIATSLPDHLKKIIYDVHASNHEKSLNRFWIESEEVELAVDEGKDDNVLFALGDIRMVVKHHKMKRDAEGKLVDTEGEDEGWDCYILTEGQKAELFNGKRIITDSVLIIIRESLDLIFWENQKATHCFTLEDDKDLVSLDKLQCDSKGKVKIDDSTSLRQMYRLVRKAAEKMGMPHQYSAEFVFAQEFTKHYNEFAIYFPEFGRLRELSKAVSLVNVMESQRTANKKKIHLISSRLNYKKKFGILQKLPEFAEEHEYWQSISQKIEKIVRQNINKQFEEWRGKFSEEKIKEKKRAVLKDLKLQIGTLRFTSSSPEIKDICDRYYSEIKEQFIKEHGYFRWFRVSSEVRREVINPQIPKFISQLESSKQEACRKQLLKLFDDELDDINTVRACQCVNEFLEGNGTQLLDRLVYYDREEIAKQIKEIYPEHSINILDKALNNYPSAIDDIVVCETRKMVDEHEKHLIEVLEGREKLEESFTDLGFGVDAEEVNLEGTCLWVPASFRHDVERCRSRTVYGGVCIAGMFMECIDENRVRALIRQTTKKGKTVQESSLRGNTLNKVCEKILIALLKSDPSLVVSATHREPTPHGERRPDLVVYKKDKNGKYILDDNDKPKPMIAFEIKSAKGKYVRPDSFEAEICGNKPTLQGIKDEYNDTTKGYKTHLLRFDHITKELFKIP